MQWFRRLKLSIPNFDTSRRIICKLFCSFFHLFFISIFSELFFVVFALELHFVPQFICYWCWMTVTALFPPRFSRRRAQTHTRKCSCGCEEFQILTLILLLLFSLFMRSTILFFAFLFFFNATSSVLICLFFSPFFSFYLFYIVIRSEIKMFGHKNKTQLSNVGIFFSVCERER